MADIDDLADRYYQKIKLGGGPDPAALNQAAAAAYQLAALDMAGGLLRQAVAALQDIQATLKNINRNMSNM